MELFILVLSLFSFNQALVPELRILPPEDSFKLAYGHNLILRCEVYGLGPQELDTVLRWFDPSGREIIERSGSDRLVYVEKEDDSPTKKLYLIHIRPEHAGTYTCSGVVEGNEQDKRVTLLVYKDITFDYAPSPQHPRVGTTALIHCRVSGQPIPTVSWRYKGQRIRSDGRYAQDISGLWIKNITKDDDGLYYCRAEVSAAGRYGEQEINVIAHVPPQVVEKSVSFVGTQSHEFAISCKAKAIPDPKYEFTKDGNSNPLYTTDRRFIDVDSGTIHFRPLHKEDEGTYLCNASNNAGEDSAEITLFVQVPPTIYDLKNVTQTENLATTLVCRSYGDPPPDMLFQKEGNSFNYSMGDNENGRMMMSNPHPGELQLVVRNLVPEDMANYTCKSSNVAGYHEKNATLTVQFRPRFPKDHITRIYSWPGKTRNITCFSLAEPMPYIDWYRYDYALFDNETFRIYRMGKNSNLQVRVREVDQGWIYGNYTCRVKNLIGESDMKIDLHRAMTPGPPASVAVVHVSSDTVELGVEPPVDNGGVEVIGYRVEYEEKILTFPPEDAIIVENLRPSTTFIMRVRALNEVGYGEPYSITVVTDNVKPPSKLILTSDPISNYPYTYDVTWKKAVTGGRPIREYEFKFRKYLDAGSGDDDWTVRLTEEEEHQTRTYYHVMDLLPQTTYELEVRARNDLGWSLPNDHFTFTTLPGSNPVESGSGDWNPTSLFLSALLILITTMLIC